MLVSANPTLEPSHKQPFSLAQELQLPSDTIIEKESIDNK